jgi:uncharacterized protein involved in exopolysaccharide biosynthesis
MTDFPLTSRELPLSAITPIIPADLAQPGLTLAQIHAMWRAHRVASLLIALCALSIAAAGIALWPRTYTAVVTLMVNYEVNDPLNGKELPVGQVANYIATQVELMQTPAVLLAVVDRLHLTQDADYARGHAGNFGTLREWVSVKLAKGLSIYQTQDGSQLIRLSYAANDRAKAALVANAVADIYREQDELRAVGLPDERTALHALELKELKAKVNQAQDDLTRFHQRNGLIDAGAMGQVDVALLASTEERHLEAQNLRRAAQALAAQDAAVGDSLLASDQAQSLTAQVAAQELRLAQFERVYTAGHPDVVESALQLAALRRTLASTVQTYTDNASARLDIARRQETSLSQAVAAQRARVLVKGRLQGEGARYQLELESAQAVYKRALALYDQLIFAGRRRSANVSVVSRATPPVRASSPKVLTALVLGGAAALALGLGLPLASELLNRRVRSRDDFEHDHGIPMLAEFDRFKTGQTT